MQLSLDHINMQKKNESFEHHIHAEMFKKLRRPLLVIAMIPSFVLDLAMAAVAIIDLAGGERILTVIGYAVLFLFMNAAIFKGIPLLYYNKLLDMRRNSAIIVRPDEMIYLRYSLRSAATDAGDMHMVSYELRIKKVDRYAVRKNGTLEVFGAIESVRYSQPSRYEDRTPDCFETMQKRLLIPPYFEDMESIKNKIYQMARLNS